MSAATKKLLHPQFFSDEACLIQKILLSYNLIPIIRGTWKKTYVDMPTRIQRRSDSQETYLQCLYMSAGTQESAKVIFCFQNKENWLNTIYIVSFAYYNQNICSFNCNLLSVLRNVLLVSGLSRL